MMKCALVNKPSVKFTSIALTLAGFAPIGGNCLIRFDRLNFFCSVWHFQNALFAVSESAEKIGSLVGW